MVQLKLLIFEGADCPYPVYEDLFHGILIESPQEFLEEAQILNDELNNLLIRSSVRRADVISSNGKKLEMIVIHVGTT
jgi:hypothetical protein